MEFCNNQFLSALSAALAALAAAAAAWRDTRGGCGDWPVCGQPLLSLDGRRLQAQQEQAVPSIIAVWRKVSPSDYSPPDQTTETRNGVYSLAQQIFCVWICYSHRLTALYSSEQWLEWVSHGLTTIASRQPCMISLELTWTQQVSAVGVHRCISSIRHLGNKGIRERHWVVVSFWLAAGNRRACSPVLLSLTLAADRCRGQPAPYPNQFVSLDLRAAVCPCNWQPVIPLHSPHRHRRAARTNPCSLFCCCWCIINMNACLTETKISYLAAYSVTPLSEPAPASKLQPTPVQWQVEFNTPILRCWYIQLWCIIVYIMYLNA